MAKKRLHEHGHWMRAKRVALKLTVGQLAEEIDAAGPATIRGFESGWRYLPPAPAARGAVLLGLPVAMLGGPRAADADDAFRALHGGES
jgi:hypothetical protein